MGADLYIKSISEPAEAKWKPLFHSACEERDEIDKQKKDRECAEYKKAQKKVVKYYDKGLEMK